MTDKNEQPLEFKFTIEVKIKFVPTQQMLDIMNRVLWNPATTQPNKDSVKPDTPPVELQPSQEVETAKSETPQPLQSPITDIPWQATPPAATEPQPLREIEKIDTEDYLHNPVAVTGFKNLSYAETKDKRLKIMYGSARVNTTWADIHTICECKFKQQKKDAIERLVGSGSAKNKYTAVSRFVKAVSIGAVSPYKPKIPTDDDPDAVFEPVLSGVIDTHVDEGGGKAESHISEGY
jgi:hypothetical protein